MPEALFQQRTVETIADAGGYLFGRRTYAAFAACWPNAPQEEQVIAAPFARRPKYVISRGGTVLPKWRNTTLLSDDPAAAIAALKREAGEYLLVLGSTQLVALLLAHDLVDEFRLMIDPVVVGAGKRLFREAGELVAVEALASPGQEALLAAALRCPEAGVPHNPGDWLYQVAVRRLTD